MRDTVFRRCSRHGCGARFTPKGRRCPRCGGRESSWAFVAYVGRDEDGKVRQRRGSAATRQEAERKLRRLLGDVDAGRYVEPSELTLGQYLSRWLDGRRVKPNTEAQYRQAVEVHILPRRIARVPLQRVTPEDLDALYRQLERHGRRAGNCRTAGVTCADHGCAPERHSGLAPKSVRHVHTVIRKSLADALERGHVAGNVADLAEPPSANQARSKVARERVWNSEQLRAFLAAAEPEHLYPLFFLVATTGLRRGEACALDLDDVNLGAATVTVSAAKSEAGERTIALDKATVAVLRDWLLHRKQLRLAAGSAWSGSARLFTDEIGRPVKPDRVYRRLVAIADGLGLPRLDVHGLRHSYATLALRAGVPVHVVSARLGHADPAITLQVYAHVLQGDDHAAAEAAAAAIFRPDGDLIRALVDHS